MKYSNVRLGKIEAVINKLGGEEGMEEFLRNENIVLSYKDGRRVWHIWKSIEVGYIKEREDLVKSLSTNKFIFDSVESLLKSSNFELYKRGREFCLVQVTLKDLGLNGNATWQEILERAEKLGLSVCPPEVGPQLRLQYEDQKLSDVLLIGMHGLIDPDLENSYHIFTVWANQEGLLLESIDPLSEISLYDDATFVFVLLAAGRSMD